MAPQAHRWALTTWSPSKTAPLLTGDGAVFDTKVPRARPGPGQLKGIPVEFRDLYAVLRLEPQASAAEISRAYRAQLRQHHPDTRPEADSEEQDALERSKLQTVMDAYAVLGNPAARSAYDREHTSGHTA